MAFWNSARLSRLTAAVFIGVFVGILFGYITEKDPQSAVIVGDFASFHSAGKIIAEGKGGNLYTLDLLKETQRRYWEGMETSFFPFAYPPFYAAMMQPFAFFPPLQAKALFSLVMLGCMIGSVFLARAYIPTVTGSLFRSVVVVLALAPVLHGVVSAQNAALSIFLYALAVFFLHKKSTNGDFFGGVAFGLWLFKPHFAAAALGVMFLARRWKVLLGAVLPAVLYFFLGVYAIGYDWFFVWIDGLDAYVGRDYVANQHQMVCFIGIAHALSDWLHLTDEASKGFVTAGWILSVGASLLVAYRFFRIGGIKEAETRERAFFDNLFLLGPLIVLVSPHSLYYELGLCLLPCARFFSFRTDREVSGFLLLWLVIGGLTAGKELLPVQPMFFVVLAAFCYVFRKTTFSVKRA